MFGFGSALRDLSEAARQGKLQACMFRNDDSTRIAQSLSWMYRKSVLVVGGAGCGKTTFLHGVAAAAADNANLDGATPCQLLELNPAVLRSRTVRIKEVTLGFLAALRENPRQVLVIDGITPVFTAKPDPDDPAFILANAIRKAEICCVATLRTKEFDEIVHMEARTEHLFRVMRLRPLSRDETIAVLTTMRPELERESKLRISGNAIKKAVTLSQEYLPDLELPGKAITTLQRAIEACGRRLRSPGDETGFEIDSSMTPVGEEVGSYDVKRALTGWAAVDVFAAEERKWETKLAERLKRRIFGQEIAIEQIVAILARIRSRFTQPGCPAGVAVFGGPSGVGKAHTACCLAQVLMGRPGNIVELDLRDFSGRDAFGRIFDQIALQSAPKDAKAPPPSFRIVLLRNMELADPLVLGPLLRVTTQDCMRQQGCRCDFLQKCFFIFSLNCDPSSLGSTAGASWLADMLASFIRSDLVQQLDAIVPFAPLDYSAQNALMRSVMATVHSKSGDRRVRIGMDDEAFRVVAREGYTKEHGARGLIRTLHQRVLSPIDEVLDSGQMTEGGTIDVLGNAGQIMLRTKPYRHSGAPERA